MITWADVMLAVGRLAILAGIVLAVILLTTRRRKLRPVKCRHGNIVAWKGWAKPGEMLPILTVCRQCADEGGITIVELDR